MQRSRSPSRERPLRTDNVDERDNRKRKERHGKLDLRSLRMPSAVVNGGNGVKFMTRQEREEAALARLAAQRAAAVAASTAPTTASLSAESRRSVAQRPDSRSGPTSSSSAHTSSDNGTALSAKELLAIKAKHAGIDLEFKKAPRKKTERREFKMGWDDKDDTSRTADDNPLYSQRAAVRPMFSQGIIGGADNQRQVTEARKYVETQRELYERLRAQHGSTPATEAAARQVAKLERKLSQMSEQEPGLGRRWRDKSLTEMTQRDWRILRDDFRITVRSEGGIANPLRSWSEANVDASIMRGIESLGYHEPTPIQRQAIPVGLNWRDMIGVAETGSGKTCAFVVPMLQFILRMPRLNKETEQDGPYALILAPTRELAQQIHKEAMNLAKYTHVRLVCVVGGAPIQEQATQIRKGCEVIIGTPGRLFDLIESRYLMLNQCTYVVLDESDRMMDMGFEPQVVQILNQMPVSNMKSEDAQEAEVQERRSAELVSADALAERQEQDEAFRPFRTTIMFSATMPPSVEQLSRTYLRRPAVVSVGTIGRAVDRIKQVVLFVNSEEDKRRKLDKVLKEGPPKPWIVFVNTKKITDTVAREVELSTGARVTTLHSGKNQQAREAAVQAFRDGRFDCLVATDVAGRGIDIPGVTHVVNYDCPKNIEDYTHRIGRTGRAGSSGLATTLVNEEQNKAILYDLRMALKQTKNEVPRELERHPDAQAKHGSIGAGIRPLQF